MIRAAARAKDRGYLANKTYLGSRVPALVGSDVPPAGNSITLSEESIWQIDCEQWSSEAAMVFCWYELGVCLVRVVSDGWLTSGRIGQTLYFV